LAEKVDRMAAGMDRPRGWVVKQALAAWVEREELRDRLTREGMAAVDVGDVIDGDVVSAWAGSLGTDNPLPKPRP
jgi:predicted transcriptional regulator